MDRLRSTVHPVPNFTQPEPRRDGLYMKRLLRQNQNPMASSQLEK
jgi:hypothetical protein